jgi:hypothetical protein
LEETWKEATAAYFEKGVLSQHLCGGTEDNDGKSSRIADLFSVIRVGKLNRKLLDDKLISRRLG